MASKTALLRLINSPEIVDSGYSQIISTISHELRTPISILKLNIQLFKEFKSNKQERIRHQSISMCEDSIENIIGFLDNIQLLNTVTKSELLPNYSTFNIKRILHRQNSELAKINLDFSRVSCRFDLSTKSIYSDLAFLQRILTNLLSNALKFSSDKVLLAVSVDNQSVILVVEDSGIGIPEEEIDSIFKPFIRGSNIQRKSGVGLGLSIVYSLTKSLGGKVYITSILNRGTTIKIILPHEIPGKNSGHRR